MKQLPMYSCMLKNVLLGMLLLSVKRNEPFQYLLIEQHNDISR